MSCEKNGRKASDASRRNGIAGQVSRYLNTIGSWSTYRDIGSAEEIPERIAQVTGAFFGLKGLVEGHPRLAGMLGAIIGVHALEQVSGGLVTTGMRLYGRGKPVASYRGIMVRKSPFTPKTAGVLNRLTGGRVLEANGYYFFEGGKTWHCQSTTFQVGDESRTLTRVQSFSIPQREYFFDRPIGVPGDREPQEGEKVIPIQRVVDTIKGDEEPDAIPGFIGSVNELEGLTPLKGIKHALFAANWLLVDQGEREGGAGDAQYTDYEALARGTTPGGGVYQVTRPVSGPAPGAWWPSTTRIPVRPVSSSPEPPSGRRPAGAAVSPTAYGSTLFRAAPVSSPPAAISGRPAEVYKDRLRIGQKDYPLVVKRVVLSPFSGGRKADAVYYDDELGQWREVIDEEDRINLAKAVDEGRLSIIEPEDWPKS